MNTRSNHERSNFSWRASLRALLGSSILFTVTACSNGALDLRTEDVPVETEIAVTDTASARGGPEHGLKWTVQLDISGGIAGISHRLELNSDGTYIARDLNRELEMSGELPPEDMISIEDQLGDVLETTDSGRLPPCADCFLYNLQVFSEEKRYASTLNDISLAVSPLEPLLRMLLTIKDEALRMGN